MSYTLTKSSVFVYICRPLDNVVGVFHQRTSYNLKLRLMRFKVTLVEKIILNLVGCFVAYF